MRIGAYCIMFGIDPEWVLGQSDPTEYIIRAAMLKEAIRLHGENTKMKLNALGAAMGISKLIN